MNKQVFITDKNRKLDDIQLIIDHGDIPTCRRCKSPLVVAITREQAYEQGVHPGVYCPNNKKHLCIMIEIWDDKAKSIIDKHILKKDD
jgi:hypothetical protein